MKKISPVLAKKVILKARKKAQNVLLTTKMSMNDPTKQQQTFINNYTSTGDVLCGTYLSHQSANSSTLLLCTWYY
jgi:hypothetical protein